MASRMRPPERNGRLLSDSLVSCSMDDPADPTLNAKNILSSLNEISEWRRLGIQLNVPQHILDKFENERPKVDDRMEQMVAYWLDNAKATWKELIDALDKIDKRTLARTIESQYPALKRESELKEQTENRERLKIEERLRILNRKVLDSREALKQMGKQFEAQNPRSLSVDAIKLYDLESDLHSKLTEANEAVVRYEGQLEREMHHHKSLKTYEDIKQYRNTIVSMNESKKKDLETRIRQLKKVGGHEKELSECQDIFIECHRQIELQQAFLRCDEFNYVQEQKEHKRIVETIRLEKVETTYMEALASDLSSYYYRLRVRGQFLDERIARLTKETEGGGKLVAKKAQSGFDSGSYAVTKVLWAGTGALKGGYQAVFGRDLEEEYNKLEEYKKEKKINETKQSKCLNAIKECEEFKRRFEIVLVKLNFLLERYTPL